MTLIDAKEDELVSGNPTGLVELPVEDRPSCPSCSAQPALQTPILREPDGALEIVVLVCAACAKDHPVWF